jgi:peroxiredoxin family protein
MSSKPLFVLVCSESHEKIQMAAMTASVAAVSERPVCVFISMGAMSVFKKGLSGEDRYKGGRFSDILKDKKAPDALQLFEQGKELGEMSMYACSMALDVLGWDETDLEENLFDGAMGLTKLLSDAEEGQIIVF